MDGITAEFADEAAFLWRLRSRAVKATHISLADLTRLDERLEAHIDGLRVAGESGWSTCEAGLGSDDTGKFFTPSVLAFESGLTSRIQTVLDAVGEDPSRARPLISAIGWLPWDVAGRHINDLLSSESPFHRYIGIAASTIHRRDPGHPLDKSIRDASPVLVARGLRAYGELGRSIRLSHFSLRNNLSDDDDEIRFSTAWSAGLAGKSEAVEVLQSFVVPSSPCKESALNVALRRMELKAALEWQRRLAQSPDTIRLALISTGIIGDPVLVPWLIEQMKTPALARVAGEAFTMITGLDIEQAELAGNLPEGFNTGPIDDPGDARVVMDDDESLPWPDPDLVEEWWGRNNKAFQGGTRHLLGNPISAEHLKWILMTGLQRQRAAAALELAIVEPGWPLFEVRAPGVMQMQLLGMKDAL